MPTSQSNTTQSTSVSTNQLCTPFPPTLQVGDLTQLKISLHQKEPRRSGVSVLGEEREREVGEREDPSRGYGLKGMSKGGGGKKDVWGGDVAGPGGKKGPGEEGATTRFLFE